MHVWSKLSSLQWKDAWEERFHALENTGLVITEISGRKTIRVELYCKTERQAETVKKEWGGSVRKLANRDWVSVSTPKIPPIKIRDRLLITTERDPAKREKLATRHPRRDIISIPAEMAFGTGDHATTATCLRFLIDLHAQGTLPDGFRCLDLGSGSAILAIAAKKLGSGKTHARDYDPNAIRIGRANAKANETPGISFGGGDLTGWEPEKDEQYELIFANVFSDVLEAIFPKMKKILAPCGHIITSGILQDHAPGCLRAGEKAGIEFSEVRQRGKWVTALGGHAL